MADAMRVKPALLSAVIAGCLLAQTGAIVQPFVPWHHEGEAFLWPFLDYPMFGRAFGPEDLVDRYRVIGYVAGEGPVAIGHQDLGITFWKFFTGPVRALAAHRPDRLMPYVAIYEANTGRRLEAVVLVNEPVGLGPRGIETRPPYLVNRVVVRGGAEQQ